MELEEVKVFLFECGMRWWWIYPFLVLPVPSLSIICHREDAYGRCGFVQHWRCLDWAFFIHLWAYIWLGGKFNKGGVGVCNWTGRMYTRWELGSLGGSV